MRKGDTMRVYCEEGTCLLCGRPTEKEQEYFCSEYCEERYLDLLVNQVEEEICSLS